MHFHIPPECGRGLGVSVSQRPKNRLYKFKCRLSFLSQSRNKKPIARRVDMYVCWFSTLLAYDKRKRKGKRKMAKFLLFMLKHYHNIWITRQKFVVWIGVAFLSDNATRPVELAPEMEQPIPNVEFLSNLIHRIEFDTYGRHATYALGLRAKSRARKKKGKVLYNKSRSCQKKKHADHSATLPSVWFVLAYWIEMVILCASVVFKPWIKVTIVYVV